jgi:hypothetical protein
MRLFSCLVSVSFVVHCDGIRFTVHTRCFHVQKFIDPHYQPVIHRSFHSVNNVLVLHLARFHPATLEKLETEVDVPLHLSIPLTSTVNRIANVTFSLKSIIHHIGSTKSGAT